MHSFQRLISTLRRADPADAALDCSVNHTADTGADSIEIRAEKNEH